MGADILAEKDNSNITLNAGNDINISTIQDYEYQRQYSKQKGGTFGTTTTKEDITQSLTNINSNITANNNLSITTGNDLTSIGTNFTAGTTTSNHSPLEGESNEQGLDRSSFGGGSNIGGNINMDIGNNLNIESLQDSYYAKSKSSSFGVSFGGGKTDKGGKKANGGFNFGKTDSTTDSQWVSQQTSIIADNNINIRTNNNTNLIGSVVASNSDNLSLNTGSLTYSDLNDFYREETKGYNFGTSVGGNTDKGKANMAPNGSTTIGMTHTGQEKEQITRATIGLGNITINSEPLTPTPLPQGHYCPV